ncbi:uncharacterized protein DSM5745_02932 [Aspergillus mulundensis]|uniref:Uncharacterized protein n=1 Tax=Aspergillus mulundensis TaxID=1810919 RepID=A0A3D8SIY7_9EURO|nr:Uncharacterized protein DSM5745_02932 [Aspergillus mulundensis]RDW86290.1 Uncharacterized protein DSM5745_02932 [Aspergillus mulundensis]
MRFILSLLLLLFPLTTAKFSPTCIKVVTALAARPNDLFNKFQREICDQGCQPTVPHWDLWTRNNTFVPAVRSVMQTLNAPKQEEAMLKLGDEAADIIKRQCGPKLEGRDICADSHILAAFGNCFKKNFVKTAIVNLPKLLPMASEPVCRKQLEYLESDELWDEIIPNNMREYAKVCRQLAYQPVMDEMYTF